MQVRARFGFILATGVLTWACSPAQTPGPPPGVPPPASAPGESYADTEPATFPPHFTLVFTREYGNWKYRSCTLAMSLFMSGENPVTLACDGMERPPVSVIRQLTGDESIRLRRLAERAELYDGDHIGLDLTPTDGTFETIRFRPVAGGRAVVVIVSGNRSFTDNEARRELALWLRNLVSELVAAVP